MMEEPRYKLKTAPTFEPVTLEQLKRNVRIGSQDEPDTTQDILLQETLHMAIDQVQTDIGRQLARATYTAYMDNFPATGEMELTKGPVGEIVVIKYYNLANVLTTMSPADYLLDNVELTARLRFLNTYSVYGDRLNGVEIEFTCGYATAAEIPKDLVDAIVLLGTERFLNPENPGLNFGTGVRITRAEKLMGKYKVARY
jgi:uncharacterized phiE125 gp8 family phage protein